MTQGMGSVWITYITYMFFILMLVTITHVKRSKGDAVCERPKTVSGTRQAFCKLLTIILNIPAIRENTFILLIKIEKNYSKHNISLLLYFRIIDLEPFNLQFYKFLLTNIVIICILSSTPRSRK